MYLQPDAELFGNIPQRGRKSDPTNHEAYRGQTLLDAYRRGFFEGVQTLPSKHYEVTVEFKSLDDYLAAEPYNWYHETNQYIRDAKYYFHKKIDREIEWYLDNFNGYIGEFPPYSHKLPKISGKEAKYSHLNPPDYDYPPPGYIQDISHAYSKLHFKEADNLTQYKSGLLKAFLWVLVCAAILFFVPPVLRLLPYPKLMIALLFGMALGMAITGTLLPYKGLTFWGEQMETAKAVILFFVLACMNGFCLLNMMSENWKDNILRYLVYAVILYGAVLIIAFFVQLSKAKQKIEEFNRMERRTWERRFVDLMRQNGWKFHRYIRLRVLWCQYENQKLPQQIVRLQDDFTKYVQEYDKLNA